jgi:hypothetical protein
VGIRTGPLRRASAKVSVPSAEIRFMNKEQAKAALESATAAAETIVRARGDKITEDEADALFDRVFYGLLVDLVGGMTLDELFEMTDPKE